MHQLWKCTRWCPVSSDPTNERKRKLFFLDTGHWSVWWGNLKAGCQSISRVQRNGGPIGPMGQPCRGGRYPSLCAVSSPSTSARTSREIPDVLTGAIKTHCRNGPNTGSGRWHHIVLCPSRRDAHMAASPVLLATASCPSSIPAMDCYMLTADAARVGCRSGRVKTDLGLTARSRSRWRQAACCLLLEVSGVGHLVPCRFLQRCVRCHGRPWVCGFGTRVGWTVSRMDEGGLWRGTRGRPVFS